MNTNPAAAQPLDLAAYLRVREEFELAVKLGARFDIDSAMLNVDALIAQARAAQPESATGTTGASIDTQQFRRLLANTVYGAPFHLPSLAKLVTHINAIIDDLRVQFATKGQGEAVAYAYPEGLERLDRVRNGYDDSALLVVHAKRGGDYITPLYLGAPASAQPADRDDDFGLKVTRLIAEIRKPCSMAWRDSLFEELIELIDPTDSSQPDRGAVQEIEAYAMRHIRTWLPEDDPQRFDKWEYVPKDWGDDRIENMKNPMSPQWEYFALGRIAAAPFTASQPVATKASGGSDD